jgi:hypothetical protein
MINQIFKNFYTPEERIRLEQYVESYVRNSHKYAKEYALGRYYGVIQDRLDTDQSIRFFPEDLLEKTNLFAKEHFNTKDLVIFDIIIIKYCNENGFVPKLGMHLDGGSSIKYTLDYQYKANIAWPVLVEDKQFDLEDNDMVTFIGSKQKHGRNDREFKDGEFVENIFFQFIEKRN